MRTRDQQAMAESLADRPEFMVTLEIAVPSWAMRWRDRSPDAQAARARSLGQVVTAHGDRILWRTKGGPTRRIPAQEPDGGWQACGRTHAPPDTLLPNPSSGDVFNDLAEGIALLSLLAEGGATLFGRHWHDRCPASGAWDGPGLPDNCRDRTRSTVDGVRSTPAPA